LFLFYFAIDTVVNAYSNKHTNEDEEERGDLSLNSIFHIKYLYVKPLGCNN